MDNTFTCTKCGQEMDITFKVKGNDKICKPCRNAYMRERKAKLREKQKDIQQGEPVEIPKTEHIPEIPKDEIPKKKTVKKDEIPKVNIKEMKGHASVLLQTVFGVVATRAGKHWNISKEESDNIASPLVNILNKYDVFKNATKNSDAIGLIMAVGAAIIPRAMVQAEVIKEKKKSKKEGEKLHVVEKSNHEKIENRKAGEETNRNNNTDSTNIFKAYDRESIQPAIL